MWRAMGEFLTATSYPLVCHSCSLRSPWSQPSDDSTTCSASCPGIWGLSSLPRSLHKTQCIKPSLMPRGSSKNCHYHVLQDFQFQSEFSWDNSLQCITPATVRIHAKHFAWVTTCDPQHPGKLSCRASSTFAQVWVAPEPVL